MSDLSIENWRVFCYNNLAKKYFQKEKIKMKKILSVFIALVLVFALCAMPASAETNKSEWKKGAGAATFNFSDEGTKITLEEGTSFIRYQKKVNIRDFTIKVVFNAPEDFWNWGWFAITIGGSGEHSSGGAKAQNNIVIFPRGVGNICINPQVLHNGQSTITPQSRTYQNDFIGTELTIRFQKVEDYIYSITINDDFTYNYSIPENFDWVEDVNGEGCVGFGGTVDLGMSSGHPDGAFNILVKEIAGTKMNGQPISANDNSNSDSSNNNTNTGNSDSDSNIDANTGINTDVIGGDNTTTGDVAEESDNTLLIVIIICGAVLLLAAIAAVIVIVLLKSKKATVPAEEVAEEAEETTEE